MAQTGETVRIEQALARLEAAVASHRRAHHALAERHARLRTAMREAVGELDAIIAQGTAG